MSSKTKTNKGPQPPVTTKAKLATSTGANTGDSCSPTSPATSLAGRGTSSSPPFTFAALNNHLRRGERPGRKRYRDVPSRTSPKKQPKIPQPRDTLSLVCRRYRELQVICERVGCDMCCDNCFHYMEEKNPGLIENLLVESNNYGRLPPWLHLKIRRLRHWLLNSSVVTPPASDCSKGKHRKVL